MPFGSKGPSTEQIESVYKSVYDQSVALAKSFGELPADKIEEKPEIHLAFLKERRKAAKGIVSSINKIVDDLEF
jgi:hypothetical protein